MGMPDSISMVESYRFWLDPLRRKRLVEALGTIPASRSEWTELVQGLCPFCQDAGWFDVNRDGYTTVYCICDFLKNLERCGELAMEFGSPVANVQIKDLKPRLVKSKAGQEALRQAQADILHWLSSLDRWLFLTGNPGTGKTTLLYGIHRELGAMAFYITLPDFQDRIFRYRENNEMLDDFMNTLRSAPVLLLDDLGLEYGNSQWTISMLANVVNWRYAFPKQLPIVVTSNLMPEPLSKSADLNTRRIASRLLDGQITDIYVLPAEDFRWASAQA